MARGPRTSGTLVESHVAHKLEYSRMSRMPPFETLLWPSYVNKLNGQSLNASDRSERR